MSEDGEIERFHHALKSRKPDDMLIAFRHYPPGVEVTDAHTPHPDNRYLHASYDLLGETMTRINREFGDPDKIIGGPELPPPPRHEREKRQ